MSRQVALIGSVRAFCKMGDNQIINIFSKILTNQILGGVRELFEAVGAVLPALRRVDRLDRVVGDRVHFGLFSINHSHFKLKGRQNEEKETGRQALVNRQVVGVVALHADHVADVLHAHGRYVRRVALQIF